MEITELTRLRERESERERERERENDFQGLNKLNCRCKGIYEMDQYFLEKKKMPHLFLTFLIYVVKVSYAPHGWLSGERVGHMTW